MPVYVSTLQGKPYARQWTLDRGLAEDGLRRLDFLTEIDPSAAGLGGGLIRMRSRLHCTEEARPVRYAVEAAGAHTAFHLGAETVVVRLPDGNELTVPRAGADFLIDSNIPAHLAMMLAALWRNRPWTPGDILRTGLFFVGQVATVPCEIEVVEASPVTGLRFLRTSHREEVWLDPAGLMREVRVPHVGFVATVEDDPPPPPDWPDDLTPEEPLPRYAPPSSATFRLRDVTVPGPVVEIGATLSIPAGAGPFPGVLFLSGSGTHDRHGMAGGIDIGTHEILDDLAEHGFVGLRYDTRGAGSTALGADVLDRGLASEIADARACLHVLRQRPETAGRPLFLIGHSQGGTVALALAGAEADIAGIVLLAAIGRDLDAVIVDQIVGHGDIVGYAPEQVERQVATLREAFAAARAATPWEPGQVPDHVLAMFRTATWLREFLSYRAPDLIGEAGCPILVCQGGQDFQVSPQRDAEPLVAAARGAGRDCAYALFPDLDHLFKRTAHSTPAQYGETRPVDPDFIATLRDWLVRQAAADGIRT